MFDILNSWLDDDGNSYLPSPRELVGLELEAAGARELSGERAHEDVALGLDRYLDRLVGILGLGYFHELHCHAFFSFRLRWFTWLLNSHR